MEKKKVEFEDRYEAWLDYLDTWESADKGNKK